MGIGGKLLIAILVCIALLYLFSFLAGILFWVVVIAGVAGLIMLALRDPDANHKKMKPKTRVAHYLAERATKKALKDLEDRLRKQ